jgi:ADP-dependent NAD(P)H-hydrate dehydratase / NAD(P)H-hydrate epimerase
MSLERVSFNTTQALHSIAATREIERVAAAALPAHTLMQRAGLSVARLVCAIAPHARVIWIACGAGNNGGDGLEAAMQLRMMGREVVATWLGDEGSCPTDSRESYERARDADVWFADAPPAHCDVAVDALLGIGASRAPEAEMADWLSLMMQSGKPVVHVDVPSGFSSDTGQWLSATKSIAGRADSMWASGSFSSQKYTLSLLTLKLGLFTAHGRDACGEIWVDDLGIEQAVQDPSAWLLGAQEMQMLPRWHASHKGSYGDVAVIGGASGMQGAALLAARAALHAGAGRVFVELLGGGMVVDPQQPELMFREVAFLELEGKTVVCGCGGGDEVRRVLPRVLSAADKLVLDADALNAFSTDDSLKILLKARAKKNQPTILTPHPLEAARLLGLSTQQVQANRLLAAQTLADRFACTVILKGSGSIIASPGVAPSINPTGDARLATAGTGDVLAGICGGYLAQSDAEAALAAQRACWMHGSLVEGGSNTQVVTASELIQRISQR